MNIQIIDTHIPICFLLFHVLATVSPCPRSDSRWLIHCQRQLNVDWMRIAGVYDSNHQAVINSCCATTIKPGRAYHKLSLLSRFSHWAWHFFRFPILFFFIFSLQHLQNCRRWTFQSKVHSIANASTHKHMYMFALNKDKQLYFSPTPLNLRL